MDPAWTLGYAIRAVIVSPAYSGVLDGSGKGCDVDEQIEAQINLALAICAHDGLISGAEIASLQSHFCDSGKVTESEMEGLVDAFFEDERTIEELISVVDDVDYALRVSEEAASADGLDIRENFALERCYRLSSEKLSSGEAHAKGD